MDISKTCFAVLSNTSLNFQAWFESMNYNDMVSMSHHYDVCQGLKLAFLVSAKSSRVCAQRFEKVVRFFL
jgi:hypothetical protein